MQCDYSRTVFMSNDNYTLHQVNEKRAVVYVCKVAGARCDKRNITSDSIEMEISEKTAAAIHAN